MGSYGAIGGTHIDCAVILLFVLLIVCVLFKNVFCLFSMPTVFAFCLRVCFAYFCVDCVLLVVVVVIVFEFVFA